MSNVKHVIAIYIRKMLVSTIELDDFGNNRISFGRSLENDITIASAIVSTHHGAFENRNGSYYIVDLNSTNGFLVNGLRKTKWQLEDGDTITIDDTQTPHADGVLIVYSVLNKAIEEKWVDYSLETKERIVIGRQNTSDIVLPHKGVSIAHAIIKKLEKNWFIEDTNSTNGTFLNVSLVKKATKLNFNDIILVADTKLVFKGDRISYSIFTSGLGLEGIQISKTVKEKDKILFRKEKTIVDNVNISIKPGELVAVIGGSGAGKSTLMDCLNGFRQATGGKVLVNGEDFYENYEAYKSILGYVPQQDIVYDALTVQQMLTYAAQLRMPEDTSRAEIIEQVKNVIRDVELEGRENLVIKMLSGGQKKRVSIAVELLAEPKLFFLDEPTSGLDPGMESSLMHLLKNLSNNGKTVVLVTHAMANIEICDKIAFMGRGGKLCYFGTPEGALDFFGVKDYASIFNMINYEADAWESKFQKSNYYLYHKTLITKQAKAKETASAKKASIFRQFSILTKRYARLTWTDRQRFLMLLLQAPLIAFLISIVSPQDSFDTFESSRQVLFTLACSAVWIGILNSIQEVCKERTVLKREVAVNLNLFPYILSKIIVLGWLCLIQSVLLIGVINYFLPFPAVGFTEYIFLEITIATFLATLASAAMGLLVSSLVTNNDRAMGIAPVLLIPQILFSGVLFKLSGITDLLSYVVVSRWGMSVYGILLDINNLPSRFSVENPGIQLPPRETDQLFTRSLSNLVYGIGAMVIFCMVCVVISMFILNRTLKNK